MKKVLLSILSISLLSSCIFLQTNSRQEKLQETVLEHDVVATDISQIRRASSNDYSKMFYQTATKDGAYYLRFATALKLTELTSLSYKRTIVSSTDVKEVNSYTVYKGIRSNDEILYYDGNNVTTTKVDSEYYWSTYTIKFSEDSLYKTEDIKVELFVNGSENSVSTRTISLENALKVKDLEIDTTSIGETKLTGEIDLTEIKVSLMDDESNQEITDYQLYENEQLIENPSSYNLTAGNHTFTVKSGESTGVFSLNGVDAHELNVDTYTYRELVYKNGNDGELNDIYKGTHFLENPADALYDSTDPETRKPIVSRASDGGADRGFLADGTEETLSTVGYRLGKEQGVTCLQDVKKGQTMRFHIYSEEEVTVDLIMNAASGYLLDGNQWIPTVMGEMPVKNILSMKKNNENIEIEDKVFEGKTSETPDNLLWANFQDALIATTTLSKGDNIFEVTIKSPFVNYLNNSCAINIHSLKTVRHNDAKIKIQAEDASKVEYINANGEAIKPTYETETATKDWGSKVHNGAENAALSSIENATWKDGFIRFKANVNKAGKYRLSMRAQSNLSNGGTGTMTMKNIFKVGVNSNDSSTYSNASGLTYGYTNGGPSGGQWHQSFYWTHLTLAELDLVKGENTITLNVISNRGPNIDYFELELASNPLSNEIKFISTRNDGFLFGTGYDGEGGNTEFITGMYLRVPVPESEKTGDAYADYFDIYLPKSTLKESGLNTASKTIGTLNIQNITWFEQPYSASHAYYIV